VHGADSCKESHHDFARAAVALGLAVICFDQRGHGESAGAMDGRAVEDVVMFVVHLRETLGDRRAPIALRGSSMGGYLAILTPRRTRCRPWSPSARRAPTGSAAACTTAGSGSPPTATRSFDSSTARCHRRGEIPDMPLLLLHAEGDEQVPVEHSRELAAVVTSPGSRLIAVPGGHHRSIQQTTSCRRSACGSSRARSSPSAAADLRPRLKAGENPADEVAQRHRWRRRRPRWCCERCSWW